MARVICNLPFAADVISGVKFVLDRGERISEEIADDIASHLASIPGFRLVAGKKSAGNSPAAPADAPTVEPSSKAPAASAEAPKPVAPAETAKAGG